MKHRVNNFSIVPTVNTHFIHDMYKTNFKKCTAESVNSKMSELTPGNVRVPCKAVWAVIASFLLKNVTKAQPTGHNTILQKQLEISTPISGSKMPV